MPATSARRVAAHQRLYVNVDHVATLAPDGLLELVRSRSTWLTADDDGRRRLDDGVRVVAINPGPVATDRMLKIMKRKAIDMLGDEARWQELFDRYPGKRPAKRDGPAHPGGRRAGCPHPAAPRGVANACGRDESRPYRPGNPRG